MHFWTIWILTGKEGKVSDDRADVAGADEDGGYYDKEDDFLKRPLSIMKNDLWEQLERG